MNTTIAALIVAAGTGSRVGGDIPKCYRELNGKPVLCRSIEAFASHPQIDQITVVHHADHGAWLEPIKQQFPQVNFVQGGNTRQKSVQLGLESLTSQKIDSVLIHDAARPFVSATVIGRVVEALQHSKAVLPAIAVTDTIKHKQGLALNRADLLAAQTPQAFAFETILQLHQQATKQVTDDIALAQNAGIEVAFIEGDIANTKLTTEQDFMNTSPQLPRIATGNGFDVHAFIDHAQGAEKTIMLCGVAVQCDKAIEGHSDGDAGLHSLTDAILGAICAGDIGQHFCSSNDEWKGADSSDFLKEAMRLLAQAGGKLSHCDITLIAQMPKISPHREAMRARVAEICEVDINQVSIKATTTDFLGFTGRKEGIAAMATATIQT